MFFCHEIHTSILNQKIHSQTQFSVQRCSLIRLTEFLKHQNVYFTAIKPTIKLCEIADQTTRRSPGIFRAVIYICGWSDSNSSRLLWRVGFAFGI